MSVEAEVIVTVADDVRIVRVAGEFDTDEAPSLARGLALPPDGRATGTVVDLSRVTFADSSFLHTLLAARSDHERDGSPFVLAEVAPLVQRLLDLTDVTRAFTITTSVPAAADLVRGQGAGPRRR